jgi:FAD/FMN-containing dehydrogenase/Fe-S oxidoreductase
MGQVLLGTPARRVDRSGVTDSQARALAGELRGRVRGEVRFDGGSRALYATDGSNYRQVPIGVVVPRDAADVVATVEACRRYGAPVLGRGAGTSLAGQCCNVAVVLDFSKYMRAITAVDPSARRARVQPGVVLDRLREAAEVHNLTFGPDPATHSHCTLGGMIGNNSCGVHALLGGKTVDNVESMDVITYDGLRLTVGPTSEDELAAIVRAGGRRGEIYAGLRNLRDRYAESIRARYPRIPRRVSGYNLDELLPENGFHVARALVGTESTCAITLAATVRLIHSPPYRRLVVLGYPDFYVAGDAVPAILEHDPIGLEGFDDQLVRDLTKIGLHADKLHLLPAGRGWLLVELGADDPAEVEERADVLVAALRDGAGAPDVRTYSAREERDIWAVRESGLGATAHPTGALPNWEGWEDSAVDPAVIGRYLRDLKALWGEFDYSGAWYGHIGQGCVHTRNNFDLHSVGGIAKFREFMAAAADLCVSYGGSLSGEHGDGQARGELLEKMYGAELVEAFRAFKRLWDPESRLNPGKVIDAFPLDTNLRYGADYAPVDLGPTHFSFVHDEGNLAGAASRCVGVGRCRKTDTGSMCPSYMVTGEERHSTRGRARMLWEMLQGEATPATWRNDDVRDALDLCLSCKGCKGECPVSVDMATYKAEFLSHYYAGRLRPRTAYSVGLIYWAARLAAHAPRTVNALTAAPVLSGLLKRAGGIAPERAVPRFATTTFRSWFEAREPVNAGSPEVLLWPDTFTNHFSPEVARAAVEVLEDAGRRVVIPDRILCCGRPLYDFGMLNTAERLLRQVLTVLRPVIRAGVPVVVLEPSCLSVFRDELGNLFPADEDAKRLARSSFTLAEFLRGLPAYTPPKLAATALVQGHCHQKAVIGMDADLAVLKAMGVEAELLDAGCCGVAGPFGFDAKHYQTSMAIGERVLLPKVRAADAATLVLADGFSCATQVQSGAGRPTLHLAELLARALGERDGGSPASAGHRVLPWPAVAAAGLTAVGAVAVRRAACRQRAG